MISLMGRDPIDTRQNPDKIAKEVAESNKEMKDLFNRARFNPAKKLDYLTKNRH